MKTKVFTELIILGLLAMVVMAGCSGSKGSTGATGPAGPTGAAGPAGPTGPLSSAPVIMGLDPTMASFNTIITINGSNFTTTPTVYCDGSPAMLVNYSATQITVTGCGNPSPSQPYQVAISVLVNKQMSNGVNEWIVPSGYIMQFPAASLQGPNGIVLGNGKLYVADSAGVFAVDNATGWTTQILQAGCPTCVLSNPEGITMDNSGNLIVTDSAKNTLVGVNPTTSETWYILGPGNGLLSNPIGVTYSSGYLYVANSGSSNVTQINDSTLSAVNLTLNVVLPSAPYGIAADGSGNLYVACRDNNTVSKIVVSGSNGTVTNSWVTGIPQPYGIGISGTSMLVTSGNNPTLYTASLSGGAASKMCADFSPWETNSNSSIIPDGAGGIFVGDPSDGLVYHVNSACKTSTYAEGFNDPFDMTYFNGDFYVINTWFCDDVYGDALLDVRSDGAVRVLARVPGCSSSIAVNPSGGFTVGGWNGSIINVALTGITTTVIGSGTISVGGVAYDNSGNLYLNDSWTGDILKWNGSSLTPFATDYNGGSSSLFKMIVYNGVLYITNAWGNSTIDSVNISTGGTANVYLPTSVGLNIPESIGVDGFGNLIVEDYMDDGLFRVDAQKHVTVLVPRSVTTMSYPNGIAIPPSQLIYTIEEGDTTSRMWVIAP